MIYCFIKASEGSTCSRKRTEGEEKEQTKGGKETETSLQYLFYCNNNYHDWEEEEKMTRQKNKMTIYWNSESTYQ